MTTINGANNNPVKTGAKIGAAIGAIDAGFSAMKAKNFYKELLTSDVFESIPKKAKTPLLVAGIVLAVGILTGFSSAIGAGIGKIVDVVKNKQAAKAEQANG